MKRRLILGRIDGAFDRDRDIAAGPWCFVGHEDVDPTWEDLPFFDVYQTPKDIGEDWLNVRSLANLLVHDLAKQLNERHNVDYSVRYWRELLILWLLLLVQSSWARYRHVLELINRHTQDPIQFEASSPDRLWEFENDHDFYINGPKSPEFDQWICSAVLLDQCPDGWNAVPAPDPRHQRINLDTVNTFETSQSPVKKLIRNLLPDGRYFDSIPGTKYSIIPFLILISLLPKKLSAAVQPIGEGYDPGQYFPSAYLKLLQGFVQKTMPKHATEDFVKFDNVARDQVYRPGKLRVTAATKYSTANRFQWAHAREAGERIIRAQHGYGYGAALTMPAQEYEYYDNGFLSWGWNSNGVTENPAIDLPSPLLSGYRNKHREENGTLLFVGTNIDLAPFPFKGAPQPVQFLRYRRWKIDFFRALDPSVLERLSYRPYFRTLSDLEDEPYVRDRIGDISICTGDLMDKLLGCRLLILDHPGTTLNIAMAANVPMVCYWEPDAWPLLDIAKPYFERLKQVGILFDNPHAAAVHANKIWGSVDDWWNTDETREARSYWSNYYARSNRTWWLDWAKMLCRL